MVKTIVINQKNNVTIKKRKHSVKHSKDNALENEEQIELLRAVKELNKEDEPFLKMAMKLEEIALNDEYFKEKKLYPNVDFYSGIILRAMGIPTNMFTVLFAMSRTIGWISHWNEMITDKEQRIGRPRQIYTGHVSRKYEKITKRK